MLTWSMAKAKRFVGGLFRMRWVHFASVLHESTSFLGRRRRLSRSYLPFAGELAAWGIVVCIRGSFLRRGKLAVCVRGRIVRLGSVGRSRSGLLLRGRVIDYTLG
jgi:hypothetical protein